MIVNGIDLDGLAAEADRIEFPPVVPGRTVHIDADFLAYQCSYDDGGTKSWDDMQHNAEQAVETLRGLAAAEHVHLHLTPKGSHKGHRYTLAILKEYQGNRKNKEKPKYLDLMRTWLAERFPGTLHTLCEADDGMSSAQYAAIAEGRGNLSIIASKDKDLRMVPGLHLDWDRGCITESTEFGNISVIEKVSPSGTKTKKLVGHGQKFFWAQMLMGDTADNISGLPAVSGKILNKVSPTKQTEQCNAVLNNPEATAKHKERAQSILDDRKAKSCGPVLAYDLIGNLPTNQACFNAVKLLYRLYGEETGYFHWQTGEPVQWGRAFASEGQLLWMRKQAHNENCVLDWWRQIA